MGEMLGEDPTSVVIHAEAGSAVSRTGARGGPSVASQRPEISSEADGSSPAPSTGAVSPSGKDNASVVAVGYGAAAVAAAADVASTHVASHSSSSILMGRGVGTPASHLGPLKGGTSHASSTRGSSPVTISSLQQKVSPVAGPSPALSAPSPGLIAESAAGQAASAGDSASTSRTVAAAPHPHAVPPPPEPTTAPSGSGGGGGGSGLMARLSQAFRSALQWFRGPAAPEPSATAPPAKAPPLADELHDVAERGVRSAAQLEAAQAAAAKAASQAAAGEFQDYHKHLQHTLASLPRAKAKGAPLLQASHQALRAGRGATATPDGSSVATRHQLPTIGSMITPEQLEGMVDGGMLDGTATEAGSSKPLDAAQAGQDSHSFDIAAAPAAAAHVAPLSKPSSFRQLLQLDPGIDAVNQQRLRELQQQQQQRLLLEQQIQQRQQQAQQRSAEMHRALAASGGQAFAEPPPPPPPPSRDGSSNVQLRTSHEFDERFSKSRHRARRDLDRALAALADADRPADTTAQQLRALLGQQASSSSGRATMSRVSEALGFDRTREEAMLQEAAALQQEEEEAEAAAAMEAEAAVAQGSQTALSRDELVLVPEDVTVRQLASLLGTRPDAIEAVLASQLDIQVASPLDMLTFEVVELVALELGRQVAPAAGATAAGQYEALPRAPVVTVMGHVDHGKTSLLDALRRTTVATREAGGITQHVGAFEVLMPDSGASITFLDTPGHAAFSEMRARGAAATDIVVLAVAADDGVMPQTQEALAHARAAGVALVVVLTKCDLPGARPDYVKAQLAGEGVELEEHGGTVQLVHTSARSGMGLQELEEALLLQAEIMELRAPRSGPAKAAIVESRLVRGQGPAATLIVSRGALRRGDAVLAGAQYGIVRGLLNSAGEVLDVALPGQVAQVFGLDGLPNAGDELQVVQSEVQARLIAEARGKRGEELRRLRLAAALHAVRQREEELHSEAHKRRRELKKELLALLMDRKVKTAQKLEEVAAQYHSTSLSLGAVQTLAAKEAAAVATATSLRSRDQRDAVTENGSGEADGVDGAADVEGQAEGQAAAHVARAVPLVVKADVQGSIGPVLNMIAGLGDEKMSMQVIFSGVGPVTASDVNLAAASGAAIVTFNLAGTMSSDVERLVETSHVRLLAHNVVYHLVDQIQAYAQGTASGPAETVEQVVGSASVLTTFPLSGRGKGAAAAGARVTSGTLQRGAAFFRVLRGGGGGEAPTVVWQGPCSSLRRGKQGVETVGANTDCGVVLADGTFSDFQPGDILEAVQRVPKQQAAAAAAAATAGGGKARS